MNTQDFTIVDENHRFAFPGLCPYCQGTLYYHCEEWEEDENGLYTAVLLYSECESMPHFASKKYNAWSKTHSYMPYVHQLPVDVKVKEFINSKYRFRLK